MRIIKTFCLISILLCLACGGGGSGTQVPLQVRFGAVANGQPVNCSTTIDGFGPQGRHVIGMSDLRFFVSDVVLFDTQGNPLATEMDYNDFQYKDSTGSVALIDLTDNISGTCADSVISLAEGTARTNNLLSLLVEEGREVGGISFAVGVPQALMKQVIFTYTTEDAPSPLSELYWSWASGYRHFVFNFQVQHAGAVGEGYIHIGSRDCGGNGAQALLDREACGLINTPQVRLANFNPEQQQINVDLTQLLKNLSFVSEVYDSNPPYALIGRNLGVACHSTPATRQPDCDPVFNSLGLDLITGHANSASNSVFQVG